MQFLSKDRNASIRTVEKKKTNKQLTSGEHHALEDHAWPVDLIA